ncbi:MAG: UvrD-helicase domain-containing protein, partial [Mailhella sp.]|nr:UvrD-helicase domain-containing protein [Mailhella sp.]
MIEYPLTKMNASAGSGKTYALTNQFVDLLFASDLAPCESCKPAANKKKYNFSELLAITVTTLAATQMKAKVIQILKQDAVKE